MCRAHGPQQRQLGQVVGEKAGDVILIGANHVLLRSTTDLTPAAGLDKNRVVQAQIMVADKVDVSPPKTVDSGVGMLSP